MHLNIMAKQATCSVVCRDLPLETCYFAMFVLIIAVVLASTVMRGHVVPDTIDHGSSVHLNISAKSLRQAKICHIGLQGK